MAVQTYQTLQVDRLGAVCTILLNKPPLNIIDAAMIDEIREVLRGAEGDPAVRVIVFRGAGNRGFSAGVSVQDHTPDRAPDVIPRFDDIFRILARLDQVTVAAVHGYCLGGACELVSMCDLVVATESVQLGQPEIKLGQPPPIGLILLPYLIGYRKAAELLLTGASISAREAQSLGLVNRVVPNDQLSQGLDQLLRELTTLSGSTLRLTKRILTRVSGLDFEKALKESEDFFLHSILPSQDAKEGIFAFLEKRAPQWTHR